MTIPFLGEPSATSILASTDLAKSISDLSVAVVAAAAVMLIALVIAAIITHERWPKFKAPLFTLLVLVVAASTLTLSGASAYLSASSPTGGPVHWSAEYQIWACGNQLELRDSKSLLTNRVGTPSLYEKNDSRIHFDGTPVNLPDDASLGKFMEAAGGELSDDSLVVPLNDSASFVGAPRSPEQIQPNIATSKAGSFARFISGQACGDQPAAVQTFVYQRDIGTNSYHQFKVQSPASYEMSHVADVPPGDCIVIEFAPPKDKTDHLCPGYGQRDYDRCTQYGVAADKVSSCDLRELR
jgi:hypothetical protein